MSETPRRRRQKTFATRTAAPAVEPRKPPARAPVRAPARAVVDPSTLRPTDAGRPLEPEVRRRLEAALERPLGHVRVHTAPADRERTRSMGARAFAHRHHIWLGTHERASDVGLLAHEVAHVAQQGFAPASRAAPSPLAASTHAARPPARGAAPHSRAAGRAAAPAPRPAAAVQRFDLDIDLIGNARRAASAVGSGIRAGAGAVVAGARAVGGAVVEAGESLVNAGRDVVLAVVRRVAPDFLPLFEGDGIVGFVRKLAENALRSMFDGLMAPLRGVLDFDAIGARITQAVTWIAGIAGQLARGDCSGILAAARKVADFFSTALKPVADKVKSISDKVSGFFKGIWDQIGAPLMEMLKKIGGPLWDSLKKFARDVAAVLRKAKEAVGDAWERVKGWFGIGAETGEEEGGGLWNWIKDKAKSVGDAVSDAVKPVMGPLKAAGAALLLIIPGGQIVLVIMMWPRLKQAWNWLSQKWTDLNLVPRARHFLANTVLPMLMDAAESVGQTLVAGADWLLGLVERVASAVASVVKGAKGLLAPLGTVIGFAHGHFQRMVNWARAGLRSASRNMRSLLQRLVRFLGQVLEALLQLIAIAVNPFGIVGFLAGTIWRMIPECLKGPIIDFILEVIIRVLRALPPMLTLGPLWPLIKSAALGFLETVKGMGIPRKVNVSNKMAKIVSGQSVTFALGFLKGLALGVWDGITSPFYAIAAIFDLPEQIRNFLANLGIRLCDLIESIRCFAANLAGQVFGGLDSILGGLSELLEDPGKILDLIKCAIEGALAGARSLGASLAGHMMSFFEGPDEAIGEALGRLTGSTLVQAVITYFTAGAGAGLGIVQKISQALGTVGRALGQVVRFLTQQMGKLVGFLKGFASKFASSAARGARSVLGKLGGFFRKVAGWFGRLMRKIFKGLRRRFGLTPAQRRQWSAFKGAVRNMLRAHRETGVSRRQLAHEYRGVLNGYRPVAKWPSFITRRRARWKVWVRKVKSLRPTSLGNVLIDRDTRWRKGAKDVRKRMRRVKGRDTTEARLNDILRPIKRKWEFKKLYANPDRAEHDFNIMGHMSPDQQITEVDDLKGLHEGTHGDPIPIHWYKPPANYPASIQIRLAPRASTLTTVGIHGNTAVTDFRGAPHTIGITQQPIRTGDRIHRGKTPRGRKAGQFGRLLASLGYNLRTRIEDADHVRDLGFGGDDAFHNLWPLDRDVNQRASTRGQWYSTYRLQFIDRSTGSPKMKELPITSLGGKNFKVIGTTYPPQPNPGGRDQT
jgi:phage-related protein